MGYELKETRPFTWFLLKATANAEQAVARRLKRRLGGVEDREFGDVVCDDVATFVPIARWTARRRHQRVPRERIVFPGYLFVGFAAATPPWFDMREVPGLHGVITHDGVPFAVGWELVGEIVGKCAFGFYTPHEEPMIQRGMRVVARAGRFRGIEGDVTFVDKQLQRVDVLMELLGRVPVRVGVNDLVSVSYSEYRSASDDRLHSAS